MRLIANILSAPYACLVVCRNWLYEKNFFAQWNPPVKTICIGNLAVGGTGKTPHSLLLLQILQDEFQVVFLSRGYKRKTKGFVEADWMSNSREVGDEPLLVKKRFPTIPVAVCEQRKEGIQQLLKRHSHTECVVLDDAMQHRAVKPGRILLLTTYDRLYTEDVYLPCGHLRDSVKEARRANWIMVTKCPEGLTEQAQKKIIERLKPLPHQRVFFSCISYGKPKQVWGENSIEWDGVPEVLLITGIAQPHHMEAYVQQRVSTMNAIHFSDHHTFTPQDLKRMENMLNKMQEGSVLLTTEKDAMRMLQTTEWSEDIRKRVYYLPIETKIIDNQEQEIFTEIIKGYVREN